VWSATSAGGPQEEGRVNVEALATPKMNDKRVRDRVLY